MKLVRNSQVITECEFDSQYLVITLNYTTVHKVGWWAKLHKKTDTIQDFTRSYRSKKITLAKWYELPGYDLVQDVSLQKWLEELRDWYIEREKYILAIERYE